METKGEWETEKQKRYLFEKIKPNALTELWKICMYIVYDMIVPWLKILKPIPPYEHGSLWMETKGKCETEKQKGCLFVIQCGMPWYSEH
jgi:hypothetical protein